MGYCCYVVLLIGVIVVFRILRFLFGSIFPETQDPQDLEIIGVYVFALLCAGVFKLLVRWTGL